VPIGEGPKPTSGVPVATSGPAGDGPKPTSGAPVTTGDGLKPTSGVPVAPSVPPTSGTQVPPTSAVPPPPSSLPSKTIVATLQVPFSAESGWIEKPAVFVLEEAYRQLIKHPLARAEIAGHASNDGGDGKNVQLAFARGYAVRDYLVKRGIVASRISVIAHRDTQPIAPNDTTDGRAQNRRAELRIVGP
jgi:outer membrane protein OmpA-like peptidoglycan-associated protein